MASGLGAVKFTSTEALIEELVPSPQSALGRCVGVAATEFSSLYWGKRPLLTRHRRGANADPVRQSGPANGNVDSMDGIDIADASASDEFVDLMSPAAVDELISNHGLRTPFARMAKDGTVLSQSSFTGPGGTGAQIADQLSGDKILAQIADGATLVLQGLHRTWAPLIDFAGLLMAELGHPAQINAYITPAGNRGFAPHYDTHDVFVLQIAGRKRWRVYEPVLRDPLPEHTWDQRRDEVSARAAEPPLLDTVLAPGDSLYLPRGYLHSATANDDLCVHLTVGVHPVTTGALLSTLLANPSAPAALRRSLPMGMDLADAGVLTPLLDEAMSAFANYSAEASSQGATVAQQVGAQLRQAIRPVPLKPLAQLQLIADLSAQTSLRRRAGLQLSRRNEGPRIELRWADGRLSLPATAAAALDVALSGATFRPLELAGAPDEQLDLTVRLLRHGLVVAAGPRTASG